MSKLLMGLVGDMLVDRDVPLEIFSDVRDILNAPEVLFANLEGVYTDDPKPVPSAIWPLSAPAHNLDVYAEVGFDVMSMANNHIVDVGYEAMLTTRQRLRAHGIQTCGAGEDLSDARQPAIVDANGLRMAFLAYASTFPIGYEARQDQPGLAPMRAYNFWREAYPIHAPGRLPLVTTIADQADLQALTSDIRRAKQQADLVITSFHWGDHTRPFHLTDHERRTARYCIDQGADMVIGHHHHALRGMEWYGGKPIMYGLCHFAFEQRLRLSEAQIKKKIAEVDRGGSFNNNEFAPGLREGWPLLPMHEDARMTMIAWATADRAGIQEIGFLPCKLTPDGLVHGHCASSEDGADIVRYMERCNRTQDLNGRVIESDVSLAGLRAVKIIPNAVD